MTVWRGCHRFVFDLSVADRLRGGVTKTRLSIAIAFVIFLVVSERTSEPTATYVLSMGAQQERKPSAVVQCLLCPLKCLLAIILLQIFTAVFFIVCIFSIGPLMFYKGTIFNSNALVEKYITEGLRLQGSVVKRWEKNGIFHMRVEYRANNDGRYVKDFLVPKSDYDSQSTLELIRLPDYPRSAILYASVKDKDADFLPSHDGESIFVAFIWITIWNLIPVAAPLAAIETCSYCKMIIAPVFVGLMVFEFSVGYYFAKHDRDLYLRSTLYGAKRVGFSEKDKDSALPKHVSYQEFFHQDGHSCLFVVRNILFVFFVLVPATILVFAYILVLGGGYDVMSCLVTSKWKTKLLETYESSSSTTSGTIVCRQPNDMMVVQYHVGDQAYKKRLEAPYLMAQNSNPCCGRKRLEEDTVPDNPELLYLTNLPTSAFFKNRIDNRNEEAKYMRKRMRRGLFVMIIQVGLATLMCGLALSNNSTYATEAAPFLVVAGICIACHIVFGLLGACIHYRSVFRKVLLYGAKKVNPTQVPHVDTRVVDEEVNVGVLWNEDGMDEETEATVSTSDESADTFVNNFLMGKFPRLDKALM